jgi:hypothetical protein
MSQGTRHGKRACLLEDPPNGGYPEEARAPKNEASLCLTRREERHTMPRRAQLRSDRPQQAVPTEDASRPAADAPLGREGLAEEIIKLLEERGVPSGAWLVDIGQARTALREADALLRRLEEAIVRAAASATPRLDER